MITSITVHFVTRSLSFYKTTATLRIQRRKVLSHWNWLISSFLVLWVQQLKPLLRARPKEIRCFSSRYANGQRFLFGMNLIWILRFPLEGVSFPFRAIWRIHGFSFLLRNISDESESSRDPCQVNNMNFVAKEWPLKTFVLNWMAFLHKVMGRQFCIMTQCRHHLIPAGNLKAGRQNRNFSLESVFFFFLPNQEFWLSRELGSRHTSTAKPAILVFHVNQKDLDGAKKITRFKQQRRAMMWNCDFLSIGKKNR